MNYIFPPFVTEQYEVITYQFSSFFPLYVTLSIQSRAIPFGIYRELSLTSIELPDWQYFTASFRLYITDLGKFHLKSGQFNWRN